MWASLLHMHTVPSIPACYIITFKQRCKQTLIFCEIPIAEQPFLVVLDKLIVLNDHKKIDRGKETHVLAGVRLLGTVRV